MAEHGIGGIDILYVNLYPFEQTAAAGGDFATCVENIDIGGPAMIRSAAKNHGYVAVCTDPKAMAQVLAALEADGATTLELRRRLAARAFARTAAYDAAIAGWFAGQLGDAFPERLSFAADRLQIMRYGENPHQSAAFYRTGQARAGVASARQLQGKALSYNNVADTDAALRTGGGVRSPADAACRCDHQARQPLRCRRWGTRLTRGLQDARLAVRPRLSAFGGIVAMNRAA